MNTHRADTALSCPAHPQPPPPPPDRPTPIFGDAFSANPHATYDLLRAHAPIMPVEIDPGVYGYLAVTYRAALYLLRNPALFAKDPQHHWEALRNGAVPADSPARMMMQPRENVLFQDGPTHPRLREAITGALGRINTLALADAVAATANELIDAFADTGQADLIGAYADPLALRTAIDLFGSPPELGGRIVHALVRQFDADPDAEQVDRDLENACLELVRLKRASPGPDVTSYLIAGGLTPKEVAEHLRLLIGAAAPPCSNLIGNALRQILTDVRFAGSVQRGVRPVSEALDEVLWERPPVANFHPVYAIGPQSFEGVYLQPGFPILISYAAANGDPLLAVDPAARMGNRGHLSFSAGAHACPAPNLARIIAETAIERILDRLPTLDLAVAETELRNRPGPFQSGLITLPVVFQPAHRINPYGR